jgi:hypothetical protein
MGRTITLDDDVAEKLEVEAARSQRPVKDLANDVLRRELDRKPFRIEGPFVRSLPGVSFENIEELLDEAEGLTRK